MSAMQSSLKRRAFLGIFIGLTTLVAGCGGFQMRGTSLNLPFKNIAIDGSQPIADQIRELLSEQPRLKIVSKTIEAQVVLVVVSQYTERVIVAFSAAGRPREIQLRMRVNYKVNDGYAVEINPLQEIAVIRDMTINEAEVLASGRQEAILIDDMQKDIAQQLVRRLRAVKLPS